MLCVRLQLRYSSFSFLLAQKRNKKVHPGMIYSPFPGGTPINYVHGDEILRSLDSLTGLLLLLLCGHTDQAFKISSFTANCYNYFPL